MNVEHARVILTEYLKEWKHDARAIRCAITTLLNAPIMPEHPSDELLDVMIAAPPDNSSEKYPYNKGKYNALRAALLTPPKPKMKTVWKFSYTYTPCNENRVYDHTDESNVQFTRKQVLEAAHMYANISPIWSEEVEDK